jgi:hypothetical protein
MKARRKRMPTKQKLPLVSFYAGLAADDCGRMLRDIQGWGDERLEATHDYIQWLFPLQERSAFNVYAPVLDEETIREFHRRAELRENLRASFLKMLEFYGFAMHAKPLRVVRAGSFAARAKVWLSWGNHNHLRITRMLKSMTVLGLEQEAQAFFAALEELHANLTALGNPVIAPETMSFWREALRG